MQFVRDLPIRQKLMLAIVGTCLVVVVMTALAFVVYSWNSARASIIDNVSAVAEVFSLNTTAALSFNDADAANETLSSLRAKSEVTLACIYMASGAEGGERLFAFFRREGTAKPCPDALPAEQGMTPTAFTMVEPIWLGNEKLGSLYIERDMSDLWQTTRANAMVVAAMVGISVVIAVFLSSILQRVISTPILELLRTTMKVSEKKDYSIRAPRGSGDEIGQLIDGFNEMLSQIEDRDQALEEAKAELELRIEQADSANRELQEALDRLKKTQEQLVHTEKMASLGGLVAGVAHEINTPVGVGVTAASTLRMNTEEANREYDAGKLTNSGLRKYFGHAMQSTEIILSNLNRAADLIHSFKQVAVDQSSSEYREFLVKSYIDEILLSLRPKLKKTQHRIIVDCEEDLKIRSVPGALSQVLTNLVMNSLIHAYDEGCSGTLTISVKLEDDRVHLRYSDDGKGMSEQNVARVFDPFFTTRRGSGGSGLGMHIVYNLVNQQLKGTVTLQSAEGKGTTVDIEFPVNEEVRYDQRQSERHLAS